MVRLPDEYQEVEYLASNGTQCIDTGTVLNNGCVITIDFLIEESTDNRIVYGWRRKGTYENSYQASIGANQNKARYVSFGVHFSIGNPSLEYGHAFEYGIKNRIVIDSENKHILVNGVVTDCNENFDNGNAFNAGGSSEYNPYLFAMNKYGTRLAMTRNTKIYAYSVKYGNKLSQNFIPCYRKLDSKPGMYDTVSGEFYVNSGTGEFLIGNNVYYDTTNLMESRRRILLTTPHLESPTPANPLTFKSNMSAKLKEGKVYFTPVQEGTGDPSPDNVRPILGWDGITVTKCGKNLLNPNDPDFGQYTVSPTGEQAIGNDRITTRFISCEENVVVTASGIKKYSNNKVFNFAVISAWDKDKKYISRAAVNGSNSITLITPPDTKYIRFSEQIGGRTKVTPSIFEEYGRQLELGSTPTSYEPYTETQITIPFPKTIYGGYVDLVNGEVVETHYYDALTSVNNENLSPKYNTDSSVFFRCATNYAFVGDSGYYVEDLKCETLKPVNVPIHPNPSAHLNEISGRYHNNQAVGMIMLKSTFGITDDDTLAEMKVKISAWLSESPIKISYKLLTPIHHTIDPQVIRPLKGTNTIYSDANGNIEIKFWKH